MSEVLKRYVADDVFREVADLLYGGGADELVHKLNPDGADLAARKKSERRQTNIARASNVVGIAAGVAGLKDAVSNPAVRRKVGSTIHTPAFKLSGKTKALAIGAAGLQAANLGGDAVTTAVLRRAANKDKKKLVAKSRAKKYSTAAVALGAGGTLIKLADDRDKIKRVHKSIAEIKNQAQYPPSKGKLTRATITSAARAGGKGAEYVKANKGELKKLPEKVGLKKNDVLDVVWEGEISKLNSDKQQVFGWASIVEMNGEPVVDLQGDYISIDEVEKSAYDYVHKSRKGGDMHLRDGEKPVHASDMIESFVVTPEKKKALGLPEDTPTGWWVGYQVNDPVVWEKVKSGERTGFSIHGRGIRSDA